METKAVPFKVKELSEDNDNFIIDGLLAAFGNVDSHCDIIDRGAFSEFLKGGEDNIPLLWVHNANEPIGVLPRNKMKETQEGLFVTGLLPRSDTFVSGRVVPQLKVGSVAKMSIGYSIKQQDVREKIRHLTEIQLHEGSLVPMASNPEARILSVKAVVPFEDLPLAERNRAWDGEAAVGRVREWAGVVDGDGGSLSDPAVQKKYARAFFWFDSGAKEYFYAYKLPFADVINGELVAVPRGIFAAAGALRGARFMVDIPDTDRPGVIRNVEKYYDKLDLDSPFEKGVFKLYDMKGQEVRILERLLKQGVRFPSNLAVKLISVFKSAGLCDKNSKVSRDAAHTDINTELDKILSSFKTKNK